MSNHYHVYLELIGICVFVIIQLKIYENPLNKHLQNGPFPVVVLKLLTLYGVAESNLKTLLSDVHLCSIYLTLISPLS